MNSKLDSLLSHFHRTGLLCGVVNVLSGIFFTLCEKSELSHPVWNRVGGGDIFISFMFKKLFERHFLFQRDRGAFRQGIVCFCTSLVPSEP